MAQLKSLLSRSRLVRHGAVVTSHSQWYASRPRGRGPPPNLNPTLEHYSPNYAAPRRQRAASTDKRESAVDGVSLTAQMMATLDNEMTELSETQERVSESATSVARLEEQWERARRLQVRAQPATWFVRQQEVVNDLEVHNRVVEEAAAQEVSSYAEYLQSLHDSSAAQKTKVKVAGTGEVVELLGTPDPEVPMSRVPCQGCGANLHCQDPSVPGV